MCFNYLDSSGQLDFEEFRDFYVRFFDNEKNIEMLKAYAKYRYRDKELEAWLVFDVLATPNLIYR